MVLLASQRYSQMFSFIFIHLLLIFLYHRWSFYSLYLLYEHMNNFIAYSYCLKRRYEYIDYYKYIPYNTSLIMYIPYYTSHIMYISYIKHLILWIYSYYKSHLKSIFYTMYHILWIYPTLYLQYVFIAYYTWRILYITQIRHHILYNII